MRQVPQYLIIGNGRVARHFCHYFSLLGVSFRQWERRQAVATLTEKLSLPTTHVLVLISDAAIDDFVRRYLAEVSATVIHFSGALVTPLAFGAHPLMTFGPDLYSLEKYRDIPFVVEQGAPGFAELLPGLQNRHVLLKPEHKALYHALCVMGGNFTCLLWQRVFERFGRDFGFAPDIAFPYMRQQTENLMHDYKSALTGPLARGDAATIEKNLAALAGDPFEEVYRAFVSAHEKEKKA